jgi:hypothetical protein
MEDTNFPTCNNMETADHALEVASRKQKKKSSITTKQLASSSKESESPSLQYHLGQAEFIQGEPLHNTAPLRTDCPSCSSSTAPLTHAQSPQHTRHLKQQESPLSASSSLGWRLREAIKAKLSPDIRQTTFRRGRELKTNVLNDALKIASQTDTSCLNASFRKIKLTKVTSVLARHSQHRKNVMKPSTLNTSGHSSTRRGSEPQQEQEAAKQRVMEQASKQQQHQVVALNRPGVLHHGAGTEVEEPASCLVDKVPAEVVFHPKGFHYGEFGDFDSDDDDDDESIATCASTLTPSVGSIEQHAQLIQSSRWDMDDSNHETREPFSRNGKYPLLAGSCHSQEHLQSSLPTLDTIPDSKPTAPVLHSTNHTEETQRIVPKFSYEGDASLGFLNAAAVFSEPDCKPILPLRIASNTDVSSQKASVKLTKDESFLARNSQHRKKSSLNISGHSTRSGWDSQSEQDAAKQRAMKKASKQQQHQVAAHNRPGVSHHRASPEVEEPASYLVDKVPTEVSFHAKDFQYGEFGDFDSDDDGDGDGDDSYASTLTPSVGSIEQHTQLIQSSRWDMDHSNQETQEALPLKGKCALQAGSWHLRERLKSSVPMLHTIPDSKPMVPILHSTSHTEETQRIAPILPYEGDASLGFINAAAMFSEPDCKPILPLRIASNTDVSSQKASVKLTKDESFLARHSQHRKKSSLNISGHSTRSGWEPQLEQEGAKQRAVEEASKQQQHQFAAHNRSGVSHHRASSEVEKSPSFSVDIIPTGVVFHTKGFHYGEFGECDSDDDDDDSHASTLTPSVGSIEQHTQLIQSSRWDMDDSNHEARGTMSLKCKCALHAGSWHLRERLKSSVPTLHTIPDIKPMVPILHSTNHSEVAKRSAPTLLYEREDASLGFINAAAMFSEPDCKPVAPNRRWVRPKMPCGKLKDLPPAFSSMNKSSERLSSSMHSFGAAKTIRSSFIPDCKPVVPIRQPTGDDSEIYVAQKLLVESEDVIGSLQKVTPPTKDLSEIEKEAVSLPSGLLPQTLPSHAQLPFCPRTPPPTAA